MHDTFRPLTYWNDFMPYPQWQGVAIDTHIYQVFKDEVCQFIPLNVPDRPHSLDRLTRLAFAVRQCRAYQICMLVCGETRSIYCFVENRRRVDTSNDGLR